MASIISTYTSVDRQNAVIQDKTLLNLLALNSDNTIIIDNANSSEHLASTYNASFPGYTYDDIADIESKFENIDLQYTDMLYQIQTINKMSNMTLYMDNIYSIENQRMTSLKKQSVNNVQKMRQTFMANKYKMNYQRFLTNIVLFTFIVVIVCGIALCLTKLPDKPSVPQSENMRISPSIGFMIVGGVLFLYVMLMFIFYKGWQQRRKDDWSKFYFSQPTGLTSIKN